MYIPTEFTANNSAEIIAFMQRYSFATIITANNNLPIATHLPFTVATQGDKIILSSHFAKANKQAAMVSNNPVLVIFNEPHAYISPKHYDKVLSVPTWNYIAVHAYGEASLIVDQTEAFGLLEEMINTYEQAYREQWDKLPEAFKLGMLNGIVPFKVVVTDLQAKEKLSQNKSEVERQRIINALSESKAENERQIAEFMEKKLYTEK